jgi:predicted ribosome quality control (RQC) complex YloA/Tae2 family protein
MSFDSLALHLVTHELHDTILNGTIRHIEQLNSHSIVLRISQTTETYYLLISTHSVHARVLLIKRPPKGQAKSHFADFLMKHIMHGKIAAVEQVGWDRVLKLSIAPKTEVIEASPKSIIAEFMGKHSNIILIDEGNGKILESIKHIDETMSRYREVLPGVTYTPPPQQDKLHPLKLEHAFFISLVENRTEIGWRFLFNQIDGLSPTLAKEIIVRAGERLAPDRLWEAYQQVVAHFHPPHSQPQVLIEAVDSVKQSQSAIGAPLSREDKVVAVAALKLYQFPQAESRFFETMGEALCAYYDVIVRDEAMQSERHALNQVLDKMGAALNRKLVLLRQELVDAEKAGDYRIKGELLTANLHRVERGQTVIEVQNYYSPDLCSLPIELNPQVSPSENAQQYFKKYNKAKRGRSIIHQLIADNEAELEVLGSYALEVEAAKGLKALDLIRSGFVKKGWIKEGKLQQKQRESEGAFRKYTSPDGFQIYVGRNSKENDLLLRQIASGRDMWLHAKQIHGSHIIIRNPENKPGIPMPTLLQAAQIAAFFSKARHASYVPVDYTWVRYVVKPKGGAAGFVHYTHQKTLYVEPELPKGSHNQE